jgi:hypothetical protein
MTMLMPEIGRPKKHRTAAGLAGEGQPRRLRLIATPFLGERWSSSTLRAAYSSSPGSNRMPIYRLTPAFPRGSFLSRMSVCADTMNTRT